MKKAYYRHWGKAEKDGDLYHLLPYHCLDVAAVGHVLLSRNPLLLKKFAIIIGLNEHTCKLILLLFLTIHDIGKFSESFQNLRPDLLKKLQGISSRKQYIVRHDSLGNLFLKASFENGTLKIPQGNITFEEWQDVIMAIVRAYTGHHGIPPQMKESNGMPLNFSRYFGDGDFTAAASFIGDVATMICGGAEECTLLYSYETEEAIKRASWLMAGFAVLCDWIGSNSTWFQFFEEEIMLEEYWNIRAIPLAERAIHEVGIGAGIPLSESPSFSEFFPKIFSPTPLQKYVDQCPIGKSPQLFILEDVTGSGKTEAALLLAGRFMAAGCGNGLFVALPTMATSNAMYDRLVKIYKKLFAKESSPSLVLAHGARHLSETFMASVASFASNSDDVSASSQCSSWLSDNRKKSLLADVGVGTLDQALLAVLPARFQSLRLFGLASHILIVDEVHAYDPYMNKLLQNLLTFHAALGGSAILLSATLPTHIRRDFIAAFACGCNDQKKQELGNNVYPLATAYSKEPGIHETPVEAMPQRRCKVALSIVDNESEVVRNILEVANKGWCVCWIRNTVHDALNAYTLLKESLAEDRLMLFHARFAMGDRLDIERSVISAFGRKSEAQERKGKILVATQVVEQSLDLDFDLLITDLAPMDLLIQRAGRLHRHPRDKQGNPLAEGPDRREPPCMIIHGPLPEDNVTESWYKSAFPKAAFVYPSHGCLWLTARLLLEKKMLKMPDDARELIEAAYSIGEERIPEPLRQIDRQAEADFNTYVSLAHINMLKLDEGYEATVTQWREDMTAPTRLGGMETTVRLAKWNGKVLTTWYSHKRFPWDMSQVSIRSGLVDAEVSHTGALGDAIANLKEQLPDKGKWTVMVSLQLGDDGRWIGTALNKKQETMILEYDPLTGVTVKKKEG